MPVRKALEQDAKKIHELAASLGINYQNPQDTGFIVYVLPEDEYRKRAGESDYFYVHEAGGAIEGFLMCYDDETLAGLSRSGALDHEDAIAGYLLKQGKPFVFGDQIGINPEKARQGLGKGMIRRLFTDMRASNIRSVYVCILHSPARNQASISFCKGIGFRELAEVTNRDGLVWGVYGLHL